MAKIARTTQKQFGVNGNVANFGQFGSLKVSSTVTTKDPATIQGLTAFTSEGWADETIATNRPALEDMNGLDYLIFYQLCYLFQAGIAEWDAGTTYYTNSIVQYNGLVYQSLQDTNLNKQPDTNGTWWQIGTNSSNGLPTGSFVPFGGSAAPTGFLLCDGSAVSRTTYASLFAVLGTTFGAGDGSTTFNLPDGRGRTVFGKGSGTFGTLGANVGSETKNMLHTHPFSATTGGAYNGGSGVQYAGAATSPHVHDVSGTTGSGGSNVQDVLNPGMIANWIIKT